VAQVRFRPQAWTDIFETAAYLESQAGFELADRFIDAVRETAKILEKMPLIGAPCRFRRMSFAVFERYRSLALNGG